MTFFHRSCLLVVLGALAAGCDEICIDGECIALDSDSDAEVALWLDWTTVPAPYAPDPFSLDTWVDRSGHGHDAHVVDGRVPIQAIGDVNVLHVQRHVLEVEQEDGDPLWTLQEGDFTVLMATSVDCFPGEPASQGHAILAKKRQGPSGFWAQVAEPEPGGDRRFGPVMTACEPWTDGCLAGAWSEGVATCDAYQLYGLRRFTADGVSSWEGRIDGVSLGTHAAPAGIVDGETLQISSDLAPMSGRVASVVAIKGHVDDEQLCTLEQFLLDRLVGAGLRGAAPNLGCTQP